MRHRTPKLEPTREELIARISFLESGREQRKADKKARLARETYYKEVSHSNDQFNARFRGANKGVVNNPSVALPATEFAEKRIAAKFGWSKRNGKRDFRGGE